MGFDIDGIKFLLAAKASGVCFSKVATIGRQELHLSLDSLSKILRFFNIKKTDIEIKHLLLEENGYAESFLRMLGAEEICSIDRSPYEGAAFIHDMNLSIPSKLKDTSSNSSPLENTTDSKNKLSQKAFKAIRQLTPRPLKNIYRTIRAARRTGIEPSPRLDQLQLDSESFEEINMSDLLRGLPLIPQILDLVGVGAELAGAYSMFV